MSPTFKKLFEQFHLAHTYPTFLLTYLVTITTIRVYIITVTVLIYVIACTECTLSSLTKNVTKGHVSDTYINWLASKPIK